MTAWSPWTAGDIDILERVHKRAVSFITGLTGHTYEEKLRELGLKSLLERRMRYDLVQTYKMINNIDRVDPALWFNMVGQRAHVQTRKKPSGHQIPARS